MRPSLSAVAILCLSACSVCSAQVEIFISGNLPASGTQSGIYHTTAGSNTVQTVRTMPYANRPIGVTVNGGQLLWTTWDTDQIWASSISGASASILLDRPANSYVRQVEFSGGMMYWNEEGTGSIYRANPDGTGQQLVITGPTGDASGIWDFVVANNRIYWTSWSSNRVRSVAMDGSDLQSFTLPNGGRAFSLDADANGLVVGVQQSGGGAQNNAAEVWRTAFSGASPQLLAAVTGVGEQTGLSVYDGRAYFGYTVGGGSLTSVIESVTLAGTDRRMEMSVVNTIQLFQIDVIPAPGSACLLAAGLAGMGRRRRH